MRGGEVGRGVVQYENLCCLFLQHCSELENFPTTSLRNFDSRKCELHYPIVPVSSLRKTLSTRRVRACNGGTPRTRCCAVGHSTSCAYSRARRQCDTVAAHASLT